MMLAPRARRTVVAIVLAVGVAACGSAGPEPAAAPATEAAPATATDADPAPRTITHRYGETVVEGVPERVVTLGLTDQDYVIALGVAPVGTAEWFGEQPGALYPWAREALGDLPMPEQVLSVYEIDVEAVAALDPDLILASNSGLTRDEYDQLAQIAPTVAQPDEHADFGAPWQEITRRTGLALGRPEQAEALVEDLESELTAVVDANPSLDGATGLVTGVIGDEFWIYPEGPAPNLLRDLGIALPAAAEQVMDDNGRQATAISREQLSLLESDAIVLGLYGTDEQAVRDIEVFSALDAVAAGSVVPLPEMSRANTAMTFGSVLSLPTALDELVPRLVAAVDRDPDTAVEPAEPLAAPTP